jgi:hypothetical protein
MSTAVPPHAAPVTFNEVIQGGAHPFENQQLRGAPHLLRLHINSVSLLDSNFSTGATGNLPDVFVLVAVTGATAHTRTLKATNQLVFDESFIIEYSDEKAEVDIRVIDARFDVSDRKSLLGEWKAPISSLVPSNNGWYPEEGSKTGEPLTLNGTNVGNIFIHARQEHKVIGTLTVTFNKALIYNRFAKPNQDITLSLIFGGKTEPFFTTQPVACFDQTEASARMIGRPIPTFCWRNQSTTLNITNRNNAHDLFVEVRQGDLMIGQVQFALWDAFLDNMPQVHYIETRSREIAGELYMTTTFEGQEDNDKPQTHHKMRLDFRGGFANAVAGLFPFLKSKHTSAATPTSSTTTATPTTATPEATPGYAPTPFPAAASGPTPPAVGPEPDHPSNKSHQDTNIDSKQGTGGTTGPLAPLSTPLTTSVTTSDPIDPTSVKIASFHPQATHAPNASVAQNASIATRDLAPSIQS